MSKGINLNFSNTDSPLTGSKWVNMTREKRVHLVKSAIDTFSSSSDITVIDAHEGGQVSIIINNSINVNERGTFLLNLEENLKCKIDNGINIWHEAIGDKSSLRNLRGIEVLS